MTIDELDKLDLTALAKMDIDLVTLLNEDTLDLSYNEKVVYMLLAQGKTNAEIARQLGAPMTVFNVGVIRQSFWKKAERAVVFSLLSREIAKGILPRDRVKPQAPQRDDSAHKNPMPNPSHHPVIDEHGIVTAFAPDKYALHQPGDAALRHASAIILVGRIDPETSEPTLYIVDKAGKMMTVNLGSGIGYPHAWETCGGHVEVRDLPQTNAQRIEAGMTFPFDEAFRNAAARELSEELYVKRYAKGKSKRPGEIIYPPETIHYLTTDEYDGETPQPGSGQRNREVSGIFVHKIEWPDTEIKAGDIRFADEWSGAWIEDGIVRKEWMAKPFTISELIQMHDDAPEHFCDALARCIAAMKKDPTLIEKIKQYLS